MPELDIPAEIARRQDRLDAIAAARTRLEQRQRDADLERGRSDDDDQKPRGQDGKPKGGRYKRPFGVPQDKDQDNFTDPHSRIMLRAGGGFDPAYNGQTAVDDTAHIIVAAELINNASDVRELPTMLEAVKSALGAYPERTLADAGYRSEAVFEALVGCTELVVAIGREVKGHRAINETMLPLTAAKVAKMKTEEAREAHRRRKWLAEPPNGWIKNVLVLLAQMVKFLDGLSASQFEGSESREIILRPGTPKEKRLIGQTYLANYGLPQFFFHVTRAYAILRHNGIAIGKRDYMGVY